MCMSNYDINDIETLDFREAVRTRMAMYLGSEDMNGVYNAIQEIVTNSTDEFNMGYGNKITIRLFCTNGVGTTVQVVDQGRGVPFGIKENGSNTLVDIYTKPHTGGKFDSKSYQNAAGLNGIGAKATNLGSDEFTVVSTRNGDEATAVFAEGVLQNYSTKKVKHNKTGTNVKFTPSKEVFDLEPIDIKYSRVTRDAQILSYLSEGLTFVTELYEDNQLIDSSTFKAENGIADLIKDTSTNPIHPTIFYGRAEENGDIVEVAFQWGMGAEKSYTFTNGLEQSEGGTSLTGAKTALTRLCKKEFDKGLTGDLARTGLTYAVNAKLKDTPSFANQTKTKVNNPQLNGLAQAAITAAFEDLINSPKDRLKINDFLVKERKADQAAERARQKVKEMEKEIKKSNASQLINPEKLSDAECLGDEDSILLIAEGESAAGTLKTARDYKHYGVLEIKGKMRNPLTSTESEVLGNAEVQLLAKALGQVPFQFNEKTLRYKKIAIASDADSDGSHVGLLVITNLMYLFPELVEQGRVHWLRAPLYSTHKGKDYTFYFTDEELKAAGQTNNKTLARYKGLGSLSSDEELTGGVNVAQEALFGPNQVLDQLVPNEETFYTLGRFMGTEVEPRRDYVMNKIDFSEVRE